MDSLKNLCLLAMPHLKDPNFEASVTYLCGHNEEGALGLVINKPLSLSLADLLEQMQLPASASQAWTQPVYRGGPVHAERGFVLHTGTPDWKSSLPVAGDLNLTTSVDILEAIAAGEGPQQYLVALGCAAWEAGQLEQELLDNAWLTCAADYSLLFELPAERRLDAAAASLGIQLSLLPMQAGHA